ncbi:MAG: SUMF1/EgtB/PvdO family nonheme iron enzyme [Roseiflexaceae bacterium]
MEPLSFSLFAALSGAIGSVLGGTAQAAGEDAWRNARAKLDRLARREERAQAAAFDAAVRQALTRFRQAYPDDPAARAALALLREHQRLREAALAELLLRTQPDLGRLLDLYRRELRFGALLRGEDAPLWEEIAAPLQVLLGVLLPQAMAEQPVLRPLLLEQAELHALDAARATAAATTDSAATLRRIEALLGELTALPLLGATAAGRSITILGHAYTLPALPPAGLAELLRRYRAFLIQTYATIDFRGITQMQNVVRLPLEQVYVPLSAVTAASERTGRLLGTALAQLIPEPELILGGTRPGIRFKSRPADQVQSAAAAFTALLQQRSNAGPLPAAELLRDTPFLVLLGDPGAGKSTLVRVALLALAEGRGSEQLGLHDAWLPILFPVAAFAEARQHQPDLAPLDYLRQHYQGRSQPDYGPLFERALLAGRALLLLDGLDEVAGDRLAITRCLEAFVRAWEPFGNRCLATSRIAGYEDAPLDERLFVRATLQPFDDDQIRQFTGQWSYAYERAGSVEHQRDDQVEVEVRRNAAERAVALTEAIFASENVTALARNPLLLTIVALIHQQGTRLPDRRADLYRLCVEALAETWNRARSLADRPINVFLGDEKLDERFVVNILGPVALWVHQVQPGGMVEQTDLERQLAHTFQQSDNLAPGKAQRLASDFLELVRLHTGLIQERGQRLYSFLHLTFEEYLAARALVESALLDGDALFHRHAADPRWREVLRLAVASASQRDAQRLLLHLLDAPAHGEERGRPVVLAGECLLDLGRAGVLPRAWDAVVDRLVALLADQEAIFSTRVAGGHVLGQLGDPRLLDVRTGDAPTGGYWCDIAAGPFWFGDTDEELQQIDQPAAFRIARFPVTNAEYGHFLADGGYDPDRPWWTEQGRAWLRPGGPRLGEPNDQPITQPRLWNAAQYNLPSHPVVAVSWYEAVAYAAWLTVQGHTQGWLPRECVIRLPTWREWQRAARHTDRRRFPWGDAEPAPEHANYDQTQLGITAPAGCFPAGQAACGALDLAGNVWEWTATPWGEPLQPAPLVDREAFVSDEDCPILAGGAFLDGNEHLCCGARYWNFPNFRDNYWGFRVVWSPRSLV